MEIRTRLFQRVCAGYAIYEPFQLQDIESCLTLHDRLHREAVRLKCQYDRVLDSDIHSWCKRGLAIFLHEFYCTFAPAKLKRDDDFIANLLSSYHGHEYLLIFQLRHKYRIQIENYNQRQALEQEAIENKQRVDQEQIVEVATSYASGEIAAQVARDARDAALSASQSVLHLTANSAETMTKAIRKWIEYTQLKKQAFRKWRFQTCSSDLWVVI